MILKKKKKIDELVDDLQAPEPLTLWVEPVQKKKKKKR